MSEPVQEQFPGMPERLIRASPSKLLTWVECPRRFRMQYLDRPSPQRRGQRAHTSIGIATHNALRDFWDLPLAQRTPAGVAELVRTRWIELGFRDQRQSARWREIVRTQVTDYLRGADRVTQPRGIERTVSFPSRVAIYDGRIDRIDERPTPTGSFGDESELVVVDYKTGRAVPSAEDARTSLALALYAMGVEKVFRRRCRTVELHHLPSGVQVAYTHTDESLARKLAEADSIAADVRRASGRYASEGIDSPAFPPSPSPMCTWCDFRQHCPEGQRMGPEKSDWAGLVEPDLPADAGEPTVPEGLDVDPITGEVRESAPQER